MSYSAIIDRLEEDIRQYRIESQRFFNGDTPIPPEELRAEIRKRLTHLIGQPQLSAVEQFRLGALEGRYNSQTELFRRRLRHATAAHQPSHPSAESQRAVLDLGSDSRVDDVRDMYEAVYAGRSTAVDIDRFHDYLRQRAAEMRDRTGCEKVRFSVDAAGGKLKARPVRS